MKAFLILICTFALASAEGVSEEEKSTTSNAKTSQPVPVKTSQHVAPQAPQHIPAQSKQRVIEHNEPAPGTAHVLNDSRRTQRTIPEGGNPGRNAEVTSETRQSSLRDNSTPKTAAPSPVAPIYHYNFRTKSGFIGRDFSRPLTSDEQSAIAAQIENGPPKGTDDATAGYQSASGIYHYNFRTKSGLIGRDFTKPLTAEEQSAVGREVEKGPPQANQESLDVSSTQPKRSASRPQHFALPKKRPPAIAGVKFEGAGHIPASETWTDPKYSAFHDYHHEWHGKNWWEHHPNPIHCQNPQLLQPMPPTPHRVTVLVYGGWYRWYGGYWYPAWGYDRQASYYPYDGPIYAYNGLAPDQVIANVQAVLQGFGYYDGPINGILDPTTRVAIASYQQDHGLYITSAIDESTLEALGMT